MPADHIYYDMSLNNTTNAPITAALFDQRSQPLVDNPNKYHLSVVRFCIPTSYIPIFIWPDAGDNTANNNYYSVTIRRAGVDYRTYLTYVCQNTPDDKFNIARRFVYSYQQFIDAINIALNTSFVAAGGTATIPPYLIFDSVSGLFSIVAEYAYANNAGEYEIYFNSKLFSFFDNFKVKRLGYDLPNGKDVLIYIQNNGNNDYKAHAPGFSASTTNDSYIMTQEYDSLFLWNSARSLVFISNTVPVANEALNVRNSESTSTTSTFRKIMTDFEFNIQSGISNNTLRSYVQYYPQGEYRLINLESNGALYTFDVQIFFQTADLKLYPLMIYPGEYISMKILFRNKDFKKGL